jgi:hypothetical protein
MFFLFRLFVSLSIGKLTKVPPKPFQALCSGGSHPLMAILGFPTHRLTTGSKMTMNSWCRERHSKQVTFSPGFWDLVPSIPHPPRGPISLWFQMSSFLVKKVLLKNAKLYFIVNLKSATVVLMVTLCLADGPGVWPPVWYRKYEGTKIIQSPWTWKLVQECTILYHIAPWFIILHHNAP